MFANVVLVDEVNRASPKTQSGLLECMQERHVTVDKHTHELARPFIVVATQNPVEYEGTYPLPEAQLDRFMVRVSLGYPTAAAGERHAASTTPSATACSTWSPWPTWRTSSPRRPPPRAVHGSEALRRYVVAILDATRADPRVELGASPRAGLMLFRAAKAIAALDGRDHALPDDVQELAGAVLTHRLLLAPGAGRRRARRCRARRAGAGSRRSDGLMRVARLVTALLGSGAVPGRAQRSTRPRCTCPEWA